MQDVGWVMYDVYHMTHNAWEVDLCVHHLRAKEVEGVGAKQGGAKTGEQAGSTWGAAKQKQKQSK